MLTFSKLAGPIAITSVALTTIYTVPVATKAILSKLIVSKPSANAQAVDLYLNDGVTDFFMGRRSLPDQFGEAVFPLQGWTIPAGNIIKVQATTVDQINVTLFGGTESA